MHKQTSTTAVDDTVCLDLQTDELDVVQVSEPPPFVQDMELI